jgi:hypothetical protein
MSDTEGEYEGAYGKPPGGRRLLKVSPPTRAARAARTCRRC